MARYAERPRDQIDEAVGLWMQDCLLADDSLLFDDCSGTWSAETVAELHSRFNEDLLIGAAAGGTFVSKWRQQLDGGSPEVRLLAAEVLLVHFLFASSVTKQTKLEVIGLSLEGTGLEPDDSAAAVRARDRGSGTRVSASTRVATSRSPTSSTSFDG